MLAAKVAFPVLFLVSLASEARYHSRLSRVLRSSDDRSSSRARDRRELGREEQDWYFEQCRFVNAWKEHLGHVSVLAFLDPAWQYSFRQAVMLELLSSRLRKSGFPDIRFFVISPSSDLKDDKSEDDLEIEAWREIGAKYEMENFVDNDFLKNNGTDIIFLQDDPQSRIWERFRASREHAVIIDRCGKMTYHVIVPWSILFFPYVKAAILSTYMDDPCGGCNPAVYRASNHEDHVVELTKSTEKEVDPAYLEVDTKFEIIYTTESLLENVTHLHHESSSKEERETSTASSILLEKITNNSDRANFSTESPTEYTTYQYDSDATESRFDEDHLNAESTPSRENSTNSESDSTVFTGTAAIFESQSDVLHPEQKESHPPTNNNSLTTANHEDTTADSTLLLDEPATEVTESDSTFADQETITSNFANEIRDNTTPEDAEHFGEDVFLPLRIIMYAPHIHKNGKKTKKYTHMILKVGDPDFHEHPNSGTDVASPPLRLKFPVNFKGINPHITSSEEYNGQTTEADEENVNQTYTFDEDESPGLYGEVADYWKDYDDNDIADRNETFNDIYNFTTNYNEEHRSDVSDYATSLSKSEESYLITNVTENPNVGSSTDPQNIDESSTIESSRLINENEQVDKEEEIRYKLIEHYNKLLSWIDYRLNK
ncbi:PREDICTED: GATA zinc finger domain-containing protein 8-like [Trachymyrmex cornetzi]|uniref:Selenoprotein Pa n=1 Tax=Trachymyrmex cornetzi TaxID=471704 RepID=A0A195E269_9HYME|nr:PREDICTED: GATA zinc finger domain-containing protein 8-like [Trachymyrmex cornetzi]KYN19017.1 Selenoprotein Pa [Trachymyrmex cornetzi]